MRRRDAEKLVADFRKIAAAAREEGSPRLAAYYEEHAALAQESDKWRADFAASPLAQYAVALALAGLEQRARLRKARAKMAAESRAAGKDWVDTFGGEGRVFEMMARDSEAGVYDDQIPAEALLISVGTLRRLARAVERLPPNMRRRLKAAKLGKAV